MELNFNFSESLLRSWQQLLKNPAYIGVFVLSALVLSLMYVFYLLTLSLFIDSLSINVLMAIVFLAVYLFACLVMQTGFCRIALHLAAGGSFSFSESKKFFWAPRLYIPYFVLSIIVALLVSVGLALLIIPGIYFAIKFYLMPYVYFDESERGIFEVLERLWKISKGHFLGILGFFLLAIVASLLGFLLLGVGIFVTMPLYMILSARYYYALIGKNPLGEENTTEPKLYDMHIVD